ncbi:M56 family metallopeptidase [Algoriphagus sp.]|uniref:M56 family metallopeptidase n=1 Tax=Algoriphagus sp. TaxID=1872435 RepID=UPI0032982371
MMIYLLKSTLCLLILLGVHRLLLQSEAMHRFNRFFLLFSVVASFLIPLYTIEVPAEIVATPVEINATPVYSEAVPSESISEPFYSKESSQKFNEEQVVESMAKTPFNWEYPLIGLYGLISLIFLYRFVRNIKVLVNQIQRNVKVSYRDQTLVLLKEESLPYSFLKYIFVSESDLETGKFTDAVFEHERTHVEQKHSWDILFIEALMIPLWFHPGLYWAKAAIKLNHEFIADAEALRSTPLEKYESQLLAIMQSEQKYGLASTLNFSLTKKRFEMMKRKSMSANGWIKLLILVPMLGGMVYFFGERVAAKQERVSTESEVYVNTANQKYLEPMDFDLTFMLKPDGLIHYKNEQYDLDAVKELISETKKSQGDVKINLVTESGLSMGNLSDFQAVLRDLEIRRIYYASSATEEFEELSSEQFIQNGQEVSVNLLQVQKPGLTAAQEEEKEKYYRNASIFVENESKELIQKSYNELSESEKSMLLGPLKPPAKKKPSTAEFEAWKNKENYALWLDAKVIPNTQLADMNTSDIAMFFDSFVHENARSERFPQEHQVHMYSLEGYENAYGAKSGNGDPLTKDDKFYLYPSDKRTNHGKPWVKKVNDPVAEQKSETSSKWPPAVKAAQIQDQLQAYKDANAAYEKLRDQAPHFVTRSKTEQQELTDMFSELGSMYFQIPFHDKAKVERPIHPFAPYMKLESNGEVYYKMREDLTADELSKLPPPPPPAKQVEAYKKVYYQYELKRNSGRNDAYLSMSERKAMFQLYNELQEKFLSMAAPERRQVKMVNFPYYRVEENGEVIFKAISELSPEQRALNNC